jgi:hypothetical protein
MGLYCARSRQFGLNPIAIIAKIYGEPFIKARALIIPIVGGDIVASAC